MKCPRNVIKDLSPKNSAKTYSAIFNNMSEGVWIQNLNGQLLEVNTAYCKMSGYCREDLLQLSYADIEANESPEEQSNHIKRIVSDNEHDRFDTKHKKKDGTVFDVSVTMFPFGQSDKKIITLVNDINQNKLNEIRLFESERRFRTALSAAQLGVYEWNITTDTFLWENERMYAIFGCPLSEGPFNLQQILSDFLEPEYVTAFNRSLTFSMLYGNTFLSIFKIRRRNDHQIRWIKLSGQFFSKNENEPLILSGVAEDITEKKRSDIHLYNIHNETILINKIFHLFMEQCGDARFIQMIDSIIEQCGSTFGVFGYHSEQFELNWFTNSKTKSTQHDKRHSVLQELWKPIWSSAHKLNNSHFSNNPTSVPNIHSPVQCHLVTPIRFQQLFIGFILQTNKQGGYTIEDCTFMDQVTNRIAPVLYALIQKESRQKEQNDTAMLQNHIIQRFELLAQVTGDLLRTSMPQNIINQLCTQIKEYLKCDIYLNYLINENEDGLRLNAFGGISESDAESIRYLNFGTSICNTVAQEKHVPLTNRSLKSSDPGTDLLSLYGINEYVCHPLIDTDGNVIGTLSFGSKNQNLFDDNDIILLKVISDHISVSLGRMRSEQKLEQNKCDLNRAQAVSHTGSWQLDSKRNIISISDETYRIFGIQRGTPLSYQLFLNLVHPEDKESVDRTWRASIEGVGYDFRHRIVVNQTTRWVRVTAELNYDEHGELASVFGTVQDITRKVENEIELLKYRDGLEKIVEQRTEELRESQEHLIKAQKMEALGLLAGGIAHDFNNMIQVITGFTCRALRKLDIESPVRIPLEHIKDAAWSAAALTHRLLAFSRKQILQPKVMSINKLISKMNPILHHSLREDITLSIHLHSEIDNVKIDPVQLEQVIMNIVLNARNAMPQGGTLTLTTANVTLCEEHPYTSDPVPPGQYVMLSISDTGIGMSNETLERIYEPFFTTRPFGAGSGLGLSTAYGIIRQSAGVIRVYSSKGVGSTFKIFLPKSIEALDIEVDTPHYFDYSRQCNETILFVEDNSVTRELITLELQDQGYHILQAADSTSAIELSHKYKAELHLLLTDVVLPGINGWEVSKILTVERTSMATLFISGYDQDQIIKEGKLKAGAHFLAKPFSPEKLAQSVRKAIDTISTLQKKHVESSTLSDVPQYIKLLIIDDLPGVADAIAAVISRPDLQTKTAEDGASALSTAYEFKPDIVMLDLQLPDINGWNLARILKQNENFPPPYIIVASGYYPDHPIDKSLYDAYIAKPIDFKQLETLINAHSELIR